MGTRLRAIALIGVVVVLTTPSSTPAQADPFTLDAAAVFYNPAAQSIAYSFRGHEYGAPATRSWWSIGADPLPDTITPSKSIAGWAGYPGLDPNPAPDVALTRGGTGLAVWPETAQGDPTCFDLAGNPQQTIPIGHIRFSALDARLLPGQAPDWSPASDAAVGGEYTRYTAPAVALDVIGRGLLIWREFVYTPNASGCFGPPTESRIRFKVWEGATWNDPGAGVAVPGSDSLDPVLISRNPSTDITFTTTTLGPDGPLNEPRQQAVAVWDDIVDVEEQTCPGDPPFVVSAGELWARFSVWEGDFSAAETVPASPADVAGPPFYVPPPAPRKMGVAGDRSDEADLVFQVARRETLCAPGSVNEVWTGRWNDATQAWMNASEIGDGRRAPDIAQEPDDVAVAVFGTTAGDSVRTRSETAPEIWAAESEVAPSTDFGNATVASLPHDWTTTAWTDEGTLKWSEEGGGGWSPAAILAAGAENVELAARPLARWAVLVYGGGDNNLQSEIPPDLQEMEQVGSSPDLSIVTQVDVFNLVPLGTDSFRTQVVEHPAAGVVSHLGPDQIDIPEPNMGDGATLGNFLEWAKEQYPADNYALVIWDHGEGWRGVVQDVSSNDFAGSVGDDYLAMDELSAGLAPSPPEQTLLAFDACVMAELEVARQVWPFADVMVASQDCIPGTGFPYDTMLGALEANIGWDAEQLADDMVDRYLAEYPANPTVTLSAVRLDGNLIDLVAAVSQLGLDLTGGVDDFNATAFKQDNVQHGIEMARGLSHEPTIGCGRIGACASTDFAVDLLDFTREITAEARIDAAYKTAIPAIQAELAAVVIDEAHGGVHNGGPLAGANGLSLYFPQSETVSEPPNIVRVFDAGSVVGTLYGANPQWDAVDGLPAPLNHPFPAQPGFIFSASTQWDEFLFRYYRPVADAGPDTTAAVGASASLDGSGSSDADGSIGGRFFWDFAPAMDTDDADTDRDGVDEADDDLDSTAATTAFPCLTAGPFPVRLVVRDDHEATHIAHFNVDDDLAVVTCTAAPTPALTPCDGGAWGDFNGDGFADLAVGVPGENVGSVADGGAVNVLYGSASGLTAVADQLWTQESAGVEDSAEPGDGFGAALAVGDLNGDGFADLAVGVPGENVGSVPNAGAVNVLYGSASGLTAVADQLWTQESAGVEDSAEPGDGFGASLTIGDVSGDGFADLAVGVSGENVGSVADAGAVNVLYGSASGLTAVGSQFWTQESVGVEETAEVRDGFGASLAVGDLNGDGFADLASGVPGEGVGSVADAGAVNVLYGSAAGLTAVGGQLWTQESVGVEDTAEARDAFGAALAACDFDGDDHDDLAAGVPFEDHSGLANAGAVNVLYGSAAGLTATGDQFWTQDSVGVEEAAESGDVFGTTLTARDLNGDGVDDLAVAVPFENLGGAANAGGVNVLYGSPSGLSATGDQFWSQDSPGVPDAAEDFDTLGLALVADDFDGDGRADLVAGVPGESLGGPPAAGAASILYAAAGGLSSSGSQFWTQDTAGVEGAAQPLDRFGSAVG